MLWHSGRPTTFAATLADLQAHDVTRQGVIVYLNTAVTFADPERERKHPRGRGGRWVPTKKNFVPPDRGTDADMMVRAIRMEDPLSRQAAADALSESGRDDEARILREGEPFTIMGTSVYSLWPGPQSLIVHWDQGRTFTIRLTSHGKTLTKNVSARRVSPSMYARLTHLADAHVYMGRIPAAHDTPFPDDLGNVTPRLNVHVANALLDALSRGSSRIGPASPTPPTAVYYHLPPHDTHGIGHNHELHAIDPDWFRRRGLRHRGPFLNLPVGGSASYEVIHPQWVAPTMWHRENVLKELDAMAPRREPIITRPTDGLPIHHIDLDNFTVDDIDRLSDPHVLRLLVRNGLMFRHGLTGRTVLGYLDRESRDESYRSFVDHDMLGPMPPNPGVQATQA